MNSKPTLKSKCIASCSCSCQKCPQRQKLTKPTQNSTLRQKQQIEQLQKTNLLKNTNKTEDNLHLNPSKYTTKLNFGANHKLFKNLTPINVNDSILLPKDKMPIPKKYIPNNDKIPAPELQDFLDTVAPNTYVIPEPEINLEFMEYEFDVLSAYKQLIE
ncbi:hypothetical protein FF38_00899 [Lucilia cuprina]|uniref:Protein phosphatase 1 regulatory subunit 35 C-terminal domain-containing protein n=1 Tax=Lucilia cuprina TaxID=7375 RepID=A0A0L0C4B0_LUCCU|nr:hypothetical protein FF38_00899 [Lucilia cuprina]